MNNEESIILEFLMASPESAFGRKEIARKADRRTTYEENPRWAETALDALVDRKQIEIDDSGHYHFKQPEYRK